MSENTALVILLVAYLAFWAFIAWVTERNDE